jgi:prepilin-type N-terminal cleavage/methylation domain-containing protein
MQGGKNRQNLGYTIVEVMIVLAISGFMFVIAAGFISGRQQNAAFITGVRDLSRQIQATAEQVSDGQFTDVALTCTSNGSTLDLQEISGGSSTLGAESECVFLGDLMYFYKPSIAYSDDYVTFPLAGATVTTGTPSLSNSEIAPVYNPATNTDLTNESVTPQSLSVKSISVTDSMGTHQATNIGFLGNIAGVQGALTTSLIYDPAIMNPPPAPNDSKSVYTKITPANIDYANTATMCITDGIHYAQINIGDASASSSDGTIDVTINAGITTC